MVLCQWTRQDCKNKPSVPRAFPSSVLVYSSSKFVHPPPSSAALAVPISSQKNSHTVLKPITEISPSGQNLLPRKGHFPLLSLNSAQGTLRHNNSWEAIWGAFTIHRKKAFSSNTYVFSQKERNTSSFPMEPLSTRSSGWPWFPVPTSLENGNTNLLYSTEFLSKLLCIPKPVGRRVIHAEGSRKQPRQEPFSAAVHKDSLQQGVVSIPLCTYEAELPPGLGQAWWDLGLVPQGSTPQTRAAADESHHQVFWHYVGHKAVLLTISPDLKFWLK